MFTLQAGPNWAHSCKGSVRLHCYDTHGWGEPNGAYLKNRNPFYCHMGLDGQMFDLSLNFYTSIERPQEFTGTKEQIGAYMTFDMGMDLCWE